MAHIRPQTWLVAVAFLLLTLLVAWSARAQSPTAAQTYFRRVVMERRPGAYVMATPTGAILTAEAQWKGHVLTLPQAYAKVKRGNVFLVEPMSNQVPPLPMVTDMVRSTVRVNGTNVYGLFVTGRKVVVP